VSSRSGASCRLALAVGLALCAAASALTMASSCQTYEPPPTATLAGLSNGVLSSNVALEPLVLHFDTPVDPSTASVEVALFDIDSYGNLPDETGDGGTLKIFLSHTPSADTNVTATFSSDHTTLTLAPAPVGLLPVGPALVVLVLPGLTSTVSGTVLHYRERIPFSYAVTCAESKPTRLTSGDYFFLLQVNKPLGVELKAFAALDVDPKTGAFVGQFTAALRNSDPTRCSPACTGGLVCEKIPSETCVEMSQAPTSVYEWPDFVAKSTAPNGYTFEMQGCAVDDGDAGAVNIVTSPGVLNVTSPNVSIQGLTFTAQFVPVEGGLVQASGSLTATKTYLGSIGLGTGAGTLTALSIPDGEAPALPQPPPLGDAGTTPDGGEGGEGGS
jgi:hypothetical protein